MRTTLSATLGCCLLLAAAGAARAGDVVPLDYPQFSPDYHSDADAPLSHAGGHGVQVLPRFWLEANVLMVFSKSAPIPPLVTTGPVGILGPDGFPGTLGHVPTSVVLGNENIAFNPQPAFRVTLGGWLDNDACYGIEASYLRVFERSEQRGIASDGTPGSTPLSIPYFNAVRQQESSVGIAFARDVNPFSGAAQLSVTSRLQTWEVNGICRLCDGTTTYYGYRLDALFGYRYVGLDENLFFDTQSSVVGVGNIFRTSDSFRCSNDFYGAQVGLREQVYFGRLYLRGTGKVAVGAMHQLTRTDGSLITDDFPGPRGNPVRTDGGYLVQPTNMGRNATDRLAFVPEATVGGGYHVCDWLRLNVQATFLYLSTVARPGDQVDRIINPTQAPAIVGPAAGPAVGPQRPSYLGASNEYFMAGFSVGAEMRF